MGQLTEYSAVEPLDELVPGLVEGGGPTVHVSEGDQYGPIVWDLQWQEHSQLYHTDSLPVHTAS